MQTCVNAVGSGYIGLSTALIMAFHRENWSLVRGRTVLNTRDCGLPADGQNRLFFL